MFIKNSNLQHHNRHYELFLPSRPYKGEPPTVAGFLLYPDTPAKMETTSREAFCFRPVSQRYGGKDQQSCLNPQRSDITQYSQQESHQSDSTSLRQTGVGHSSREKEHGQDMLEDKRDQMGLTAEQDAREMKSQYQKDFPPPSSCRRRRTPALPQPDNIGINPAFRFEFSTVQREAYPGWSLMNPGYTGYTE